MSTTDWDRLPADPHGIVPVGFTVIGQYEVIRFTAPAGKAVLELMVCLKYPGYVPNVHGYSTTRDYLSVLRDYLAGASPEALQESRDRWRQEKIAALSE